MKKLKLVPGKLYKVIEEIGCTKPTYVVIPTSTIVMLIEIKAYEYCPHSKLLVFLVGKQILSANFGDHQFPEYLVGL